MFSKDLLSRAEEGGVKVKGSSNFCREGEEEEDLFARVLLEQVEA